ncbi:activity-regulated cytoskeleton associated protein 1-like [Eurosta solidaginis]|uniref:activity-regulated cytoskeleton associated protein 1-like n=1 Tax=Eurosta solidaginis TaxID=178769 RepID=UPI00353118FD
MTENVIRLTKEELKSLIEAAVSGDSKATPTTVQAKGSFTNCTSRFRGKRDHESVEEFITSIVTYKEIAAISDEDALKGLSLLLVDNASTWWQGVRKEAQTWDAAISMIRENFAPKKPAYQIYLELFGRKQDEHSAIDTFICQKRALLAQLPEGRHDVETELDLIFGLLHIKYRKHIQRQDVQTFRELLEKGRIIEYNNLEFEASQSAQARDTKRLKRCSFCNFRGHTYDECRKRKSEIERNKEEGKSKDKSE